MQLSKTTGNGVRALTQSEVKQIGGRAGRSKEDGRVTAFHKRDLKRLKTLFE